MCICKENNWCRQWEETQGGKYPPSDHAPGCDEYKPEEFFRIEHDMTFCIVEPGELTSFIDEEGEYNVSMVMLTRDQFNKLPEFNGF